MATNLIEYYLKKDKLNDLSQRKNILIQVIHDLSKQFNFSIDECRELLSLYENKRRPSKDVKKLTLEKISQIDEKLKQLQNLKDELSYLADNCQGDERPNCPILDALSKK